MRICSPTKRLGSESLASLEQAERTTKEHGIAKVYASLHWLNSFVSFGSEASFPPTASHLIAAIFEIT